MDQAIIAPHFLNHAKITPYPAKHHSKREYARDDDGDGIREVHCNTMEGTWTGLRNFLRPFRGVHKKYLAQYVTMFQWAHNLKRVTDKFLRALMAPRFIFWWRTGSRSLLPAIPWWRSMVEYSCWAIRSRSVKRPRTRRAQDHSLLQHRPALATGQGAASLRVHPGRKGSLYPHVLNHWRSVAHVGVCCPSARGCPCGQH